MADEIMVAPLVTRVCALVGVVHIAEPACSQCYGDRMMWCEAMVWCYHGTSLRIGWLAYCTSVLSRWQCRCGANRLLGFSMTRTQICVGIHVTHLSLS